MLRHLVDLVAPPCCAICSARCVGGDLLCSACEAALCRLRPVAGLAPGVDIVWSAGSYEGTARDLVAALKFGRRLRLAEVGARVIARSAPAEVLSGALVPVPPSPLRARWRGFDPAHLIATALARATGLPFVTCLRRANGARQVGRSRSARLTEPPLVHVPATAPESAVLVDDVVTTGATLAACAAALRAAGSDRVVAVTFASSVGGSKRVAPARPAA
jgi:ComF family protein